MGTARVASCVMRVAILEQSVAFYRDVFGWEVAIREPGAALLLDPSGFQFYLRVADPEATVSAISDIGVSQVIWSVEDDATLDQIAMRLRAIYPSTYTNTANGITFVDGLDPDGNRVLITSPTPHQLPREVIDGRLH